MNLPDIESVYDVPFNVLRSGVLEILNKFVQDDSTPDMGKWKEFSERRAKKYKRTIKVGLVAKYVGNEDTYICVTEALKAAAAWNSRSLELKWINSEECKKEDLEECDGIVVPGGFGKRGVEGKIIAADWAFKHDVPFLGLCLGMQAAVIASARRAGVKNANSEEFGASEEDRNNVIYIMEGQKGKEETGGTMRLGEYPAKLAPGSEVARIYGSEEVRERHRHRFEVNKKFVQEIEKGGLRISGTSPDGELVEFVEAEDKKFYIATQAHPEFKSRPLSPHPLFMEFVKSML